MDFNQFDCMSSDETFEFPLQDPAGNPLVGDDGEPVVFHCLPPFSEEFQKRRDALAEEVRAARSGDKPMDTDLAKAFERRSVVLVIAGWSDNWKLDGEKLEYSQANAVRVIKRVPHIRGLIDAAGKNPRVAWLGMSKRRSSGADGTAGSASGTKKPAKPAKTS